MQQGWSCIFQEYINTLGYVCSSSMFVINYSVRSGEILSFSTVISYLFALVIIIKVVSFLALRPINGCLTRHYDDFY